MPSRPGGLARDSPAARPGARLQGLVRQQTDSPSWPKARPAGSAAVRPPGPAGPGPGGRLRITHGHDHRVTVMPVDRTWPSDREGDGAPCHWPGRGSLRVRHPAAAPAGVARRTGRPVPGPEAAALTGRPHWQAARAAVTAAAVPPPGRAGPGPPAQLMPWPVMDSLAAVGGPGLRVGSNRV